jgi:trimeric autotransporter adhesin
VQDAAGNTVTSGSYSIDLSITSGTGASGAGLTCTTDPLTSVSGVASFSGCSIDKAGTGYTLTATNASLASAVSTAFNITVGPAARLAFTQHPSSPTTVGTAFTTQPVVVIQDAGGNLVNSTAQITLAITAGTGTAGASLSCTTNPLAAIAGTATFAGCSVNTAGTGYTLTATSGALAAAVSNPFTITAASAGITFVAQANNAGASNSATVNRPASVVEGHYILAQITFEKGSNTTITVPVGSGWNLAIRTDNADYGQAIYWKVAGTSEPTSYSWGLDSSQKWGASIIAYSGVHASAPVVSGAAGKSTTAEAPGITVPTANSMLVYFVGLKAKPGAISTPTEMLSRYLFQPDTDVTQLAAQELRTSSGATGVRQSTVTLETWIAQLIALRPQ